MWEHDANSDDIIILSFDLLPYVRFRKDETARALDVTARRCVEGSTAVADGVLLVRCGNSVLEAALGLRVGLSY